MVDQIIQAHRAAADGFHEVFAVLDDQRVFPVFLLHLQPRRQDANDGYEGKADDGKADGDFHHGESPLVSRGRMAAMRRAGAAGPETCPARQAVLPLPGERAEMHCR